MGVTQKAIDQSSEFGCPNVIAFTGFSEGLSKEDGAKNCIDGFKKLRRNELMAKTRAEIAAMAGPAGTSCQRDAANPAKTDPAPSNAANMAMRSGVEA